MSAIFALDSTIQKWRTTDLSEKKRNLDHLTNYFEKQEM